MAQYNNMNLVFLINGLFIILVWRSGFTRIIQMNTL